MGAGVGSERMPRRVDHCSLKSENVVMIASLALAGVADQATPRRDRADQSQGDATVASIDRSLWPSSPPRDSASVARADVRALAKGHKKFAGE
jgi:hypothetical protein